MAIPSVSQKEALNRSYSKARSELVRRHRDEYMSLVAQFMKDDYGYEPSEEQVRIKSWKHK